MNNNRITPYDPNAALKISVLRENYIDAMSSCRSVGGPNVSPLDPPLMEMAHHKRLIFDAMLSSYKTTEDLTAHLFNVDGLEDSTDILDIELRKDLRQAFVSYKSLRRGQPSYSVIGPVFARVADIMFGQMQYESHWTAPKCAPSSQNVFTAVEVTANAVNICFAATNKNNLLYDIEFLGDMLHRELGLLPPKPDMAIAGKPVQVFLHTPDEASFAAETFAFVHPVRRTIHTKYNHHAECVPLDALPPAIEYGFYKCARKEENFFDPAMAAMRGFALRVGGFAP